MTWIICGIGAGLFFAIYNSFLKLGSNDLHALVGSISLSVASVVVTLGLVAAFKASGQEINITSRGVKLACIAGVFSAFGSYLYFLMYQKKAPISIGLPLLSVSTILFSGIIGLMFFGEKLTGMKILGLLLAVASIVVMSI
jgi:drug/metabolite transporter (DMT)-like permease